MKQGFDDGLFNEGSGTLADVDLDAERSDDDDDDEFEDEDERPVGWEEDPLLIDDALRDDDRQVS
jgi:hypothetical protein